MGKGRGEGREEGDGRTSPKTTATGLISSKFLSQLRNLGLYAVSLKNNKYSSLNFAAHIIQMLPSHIKIKTRTGNTIAEKNNQNQSQNVNV